MNTYMSGSLVRTTAQFSNSAGALASPSAATLKYRAGSGATQTVSAPVNDAVGVFHYDIDTTGWTGPGDQLYTCEWIGTGVVQAINTDYFSVEPPAL